MGVTPQGMRPRFHPTRLGARRARLTTLPVEGRVIGDRGKGSPTEETAMNKITRSKDLILVDPDDEIEIAAVLSLR